jgi:hypothetical protein
MLMTMKAKWYQREMENTLVRVISKDRAENEQRNMPINEGVVPYPVLFRAMGFIII